LCFINDLILSIVRQYQNTKHITVPDIITGALVISSSGTPSADGANWRNEAPEAVLIANATKQFENFT